MHILQCFHFKNLKTYMEVGWSLTDLCPINSGYFRLKSGKKKNNYFLRHLPLSVGFFFFVSLSFLFFSSSCLYIFLSCFFVRLCWKRENLIIKLGPCLFCFLCLIVLFLSLFCFFLCFVCLSMLKEGKSHYSLEGRGTTWSSGGTRSWGRGCRKGGEGWSSAVGRSTYEPAVV